MVDGINSAMISMLPGETKEYLSFDCVSKCSDIAGDVDLLYLVEFLNSLKVNNFHDHCLVLKVGVPVMLLRNLNQTAGLCNVYVPRIVWTSANKKWPFTLQRCQFPIRVCYAMTINKSQGQTLSAVGLYLRNPVCSHEDGDNGCGKYTKNIVYPEVFASLRRSLSS
ncbi:hypothetical protein SETIT_8G102200v2 [Setaria italica]|uniref:DNA helicase Pif1-like 2B domain-containing protein n=1 Tax=Setaria italica TaxID=4555 RepID=A0A368S662_SETIT|nr:hypothetical protein SETIT_8G102200v2 [Setaria italica]